MNESTEKRNPLLVPASIVFAGLLIAASVMYSGNGGSGENTLPKNTVAGAFDYVAVAKELGLDTKKFSTCVANRTYKGEVEKDLKAGIDAGVDGTPGTFINDKFISGAVPYATFKAAIDAELANPAPKAGPGVDDDVILGNANAQVTIVSFGDFQCPFCGQLFRTAEQEIRRDYIDTGKAKMVYRDFPLSSIHPAAIPAAEAAQCAAEQGKYWAYHDILFERQAEIR